MKRIGWPATAAGDITPSPSPSTGHQTVGRGRSRSRLVLAILVVAAGPVIGACSGDTAASEQGPTTTLDGLVARMLEDGTVDFDEYREAQQHVIDCLAGLGWEAEFQDRGQMMIVQPDTDPRPQSQLDRDYDTCYQPISPALMAYEATQRPPADVAEQRFNRCIRESFGLDHDPTLAELDEMGKEHSDLIITCIQQANTLDGTDTSP